MTEQMEHTGECMAAAGPGEQHAKLEPFVGTFRAEVKLWMGPGEPHVSTGTMTNEWMLDGRFLEQRYTGDPSEGPFTEFKGRGCWGYNTTTGQYEGMWIDTASTAIQTEKGKLDASGKVWTMCGETANPMTGDPMKKKSVITLKDRDHHAMAMFFQGPDGKDIKGMEIKYTRKG